MNELRFYVWADGDYSETPLHYKSDDYIIFTEKTPIGDLISWCGFDNANIIIREFMGI